MSVKSPFVQPQALPQESGFRIFLDWIDRELADAFFEQKGKGSDVLLRLRQVFSDQSEKQAVASFYRLRAKLEEKHFLLTYRIRRWLAIHFQVQVSDPLQRSSPCFYSLDEGLSDVNALRRCFFEHAASVVAPSDLRIQIVRA